jgi:hypothetical protein
VHTQIVGTNINSQEPKWGEDYAGEGLGEKGRGAKEGDGE